jgi:hypothetical protein
MIYYILLPGDSESDLVDGSDNFILGEVSFKTFYPGLGLKALMNMVEKQPELLTKVTIKSDRNESISVEEFLTRIQPLKIYR